MENPKTNFNEVRIKLFLFLCLLFGLSNITQAQNTSNGTLDFNLLAFGSHPCAIWIENANGDYLETVYLSEFVGLEGAGWPRPSGKGWQCVMPIWAHRRNVVQDGSIYPPPRPTPPLDGIDAVSGATPTEYNSPTYSLSLDNYPYGTYRCWIEINGNDDENEYYPLWGNGQPSVVFFVDIYVSESPDEATTDSYYGYSEHDGLNGDIYPPDYTITTAADLLQTQNGYKFKVNFTPDNTIPEVAIEHVVNGDRCGSGTVNLGASASPNTAEIHWYANQTSTTVLATGTSYAPSISSSTTYYVDATYDGNTSDRVAVTATVNPIPSITSTTDDSRTGTGIVDLVAASDIGTISWYSTQTGGSSLFTGTNFSPTISSTTTFYVEATQNGCASTPRTAITGTVNSILPVISDVSSDSRCGSGTVSLGASASPDAAVIRWYATQTSTTVLATGTSYSPSISTTTTFYVDATYDGNTSDRVAVTATVNSVPSITNTTDDSRTGTGIVDLVAASDIGTISWYSTQTGGSSLFTGTNYSPTISSTTTFYVEATQNGCTSTPRTAITGTVNSILPVISDVSSDSRCGSGTVSLGASASPDAAVIRWYATQTSTTVLATGTSYSPSISTTTTYYVDATYDGNTSDRVAVTATVNSVPSITNTTDDSRTGTGIVDLVAASDIGTISWYSTQTGGSSLFTGTNYSPTISSTTTFYVEATQNGCASTPRTAITGTVNSILPVISDVSSDSRCGSGTVSLGASASPNTAEIHWYANQTSTTVLATGTSYAPSISSSTTYYVDATYDGTTSDRVAVTATVNPMPSITNTTDDSRTGTGIVNLVAASDIGTISWYSTQTGGSSLFTGTNYSPTISSTTTFYVEATQNGCTSTPRTAITGTVNSILPVISDVSSDSRCGSGTVSLGASASPNTAEIHWYANQTSTTVLATGTSYSPSISTTTTFYVDATYDGNTSDRVAVTATVNPIPAITGTTGDSREEPGEVTLEANADNGNVLWYDAETEGNLLHEGTSYSTTISTTTVFYVEASNNVCTSSSRTAVTASINGQNQMPEIIEVNNATRCGPGEIEVSAKANKGTINWYGWSWSSMVLATGESYSPNISYTRTYYVEAIDENGNTSERVPVTATMNQIPTFWRITDDSIEDPGYVTLIAGGPGEVYWYDAETGGELLDSGMYFTTYISATTTFYVEAINNGCVSSPRTPITGAILNSIYDKDQKNVMSINGLFETENNHISVYPNPGFDFITIELDTDQQIDELTIIDQSGRIKNQLKNLSSGSSIDISAYESGLYYLKVILKNKTLVKKFIKQ